MEINIYAIFALIAGISNTLFGFLVYIKNKKRLFNQLYGLFSIGFAVWTFSYFIWLLQTEEIAALFWSRFLNLGATLIPVFFLHWILSFLKLDKKRRWLIFFAYFLTVIFVFFSFSPFYIKEVKQVLDFAYWPQAGPLYTIFLFVSYIGFIGYAFIELLRYYQKTEGETKIRIRYLVIASIIGFGGGAVNFPLMYDIPLMPPWGMFLVIIHPFFFSYAIFKHHLFDIKVIATELLVLILWIFLLIKTVLSETYQEIIINGIILITVIIVGYLLVRSVLKEIKYREEIKESYEVEKKAHKELVRLDEAKNQFIMATQHHLRTPLTSMRGYLDLIFGGTYGKVPAKLKDPIFKFQVSTNRLIRTVNDFLDVTQFQLGKKVISLQLNVQIKPILKEIVDELQFEAKARNIYLKFQKPEKIPKIKADPEKLKIALFNLVDNGIKYTHKGGVTIKIKYQKSNIKNQSKLQIIVKDTGLGISREEVKNLFVRLFERGKEAKEIHGTGRGIGLFIASHIIKAHKGKIWAESEGKGKGSAFYVELPIGNR